MKNILPERQTAALLKSFEAQRKKLGLSHQAVADRAGIARSTVSMVMRQKSTPTISMCFKIAAALEISLTELVKKSEKP
jgi:transcriptional regulator with XRE-family HTH domain